MKKLVLLSVLLFITVINAAFAADIYYYQTKFTHQVDSFKAGLKSEAAFEKVLLSLDSLQRGLVKDATIIKKEPLLSEIQAVFTFIGEISPGVKSYMLDNDQKAKAMKLLGVTEQEFPDSTSCLPITRIELWNTYNCYMVTNNSDSMMVKYKYSFLVQRKYSSYTGYVSAGVSPRCSRSIFDSFNKMEIVFDQEKCEQELGVVRYIQPEIIQPKVEEYAEPDYFSPQQKKALKVKLKEKLKKEKEKAKKKAVKEKNKKKKELVKLRKAKKKEAMKAREAKKKEAEAKKKAALKAKKK